MRQKKWYSHLLIVTFITTIFMGCNSNGESQSSDSKKSNTQQKSVVTSENYINIAKFQYQKSRHISTKVAQRRITEAQKRENLRQKSSSSNQKNSLYVRSGQNSMHIRNGDITILVNLKKDKDIVTVTLYKDKKILKSSDMKYSDFMNLSGDSHGEQGEKL